MPEKDMRSMAALSSVMASPSAVSVNCLCAPNASHVSCQNHGRAHEGSADCLQMRHTPNPETWDGAALAIPDV